MQETKPWWMSKTIQGAIASAIIGLAAIFGVNIADLSGDLLRGIEGVALLVTAGFTIYGRFKAQRAITLKN